MKKLFIMLTAATVCLSSLTACGGKEATTTEITTVAVPETEETTTAEAVTEEETTEASVAGRVSESQEYYSQDVYILNGTGVGITELYFSLSEEDNWGEDLLAGQSFEDGKTMEFTTDEVGTEDTMWDILAIDEDGDELVFTDVNLSSITDLKLHWGADGKTPSVTSSNSNVEAQYSQDLDIINGTGVEIHQVYISLSDDDNWGEEMLGDSIFAVGDSLHFSTDFLGDEDSLWDIKIIDEDGDEVIFEGVDFSSSTELNLNWGSDGQTPTVTMK